MLDAAKAEPPPPAEQQPPAPTEAKPDKKEPPKVDPIAETLKKEEAKKKAEDKAKAKAAQQQAKPQPQFDPTKIAALLDKREPTRQASAADTLSPAPSLGKSDGHGRAIVAERDRRAAQAPRRMLECAGRARPMAARSRSSCGCCSSRTRRSRRRRNWSRRSASPFGPAMAESAKRAIMTCQPFTMLRPEHYEQWKDIEITFDPREMFGG